MRQKILFLSLVSAAGLWPCAGGAAEAGAADSLEPHAIATAWLGTRYRYGGKSPESGFDCSGLVAHAFERARGITLPRDAEGQSKVGVPVKRAALAPGDLVFYNTRKRAYSHVGIYLGDGRFIHAPRPGERVRVENMHAQYWRARFNGARRIGHPGA